MSVALTMQLARLCWRGFLVGALILTQGCAETPLPKPDSKPALQAEVLRVLREHPEVIVESVTAYQARQAAEQQTSQERTQRDKFANANPQDLIGDSPTTGSPARSIVLIEYADFQCPFCGNAAGALREFAHKHQDEVTVVFKHLPLVELHPEALAAARAAWAAQRQGKFWEYHDALFADQHALNEARYRAIAAMLKLNLKQFEADRISSAAAAAIQRDIDQANEFGITGTPFFVMNKVPFSGAQKAEMFERYLSRSKENLNKKALTR